MNWRKAIVIWTYGSACFLIGLGCATHPRPAWETTTFDIEFPDNSQEHEAWACFRTDGGMDCLDYGTVTRHAIRKMKQEQIDELRLKEDSE